ncbi:1-phosphofructokinase family hexose kinase [Microbacterium sp. CJ88]|uniref:1-phosphofructokinase family hexose kinase n=1 Tax=Microbacterium sp. CJ88 TaxID=3445672 RepID=UPI003F65B109
MTIVTLTAAGAVDATYRVASVRPGAFTRASSYEREMSGKGVNVSAGLALAGVPTAAVVVIGADDLDFAHRSPHAALLRPVTVPGATRVNTSIIDDAGATTKVNAPTLPVTAETWDAVVQATLAELDGADWLVVSGTVPVVGDGLADLSALLAGARDRGVRIAVDGSGAVLARVAAHPDGVRLIKPNADELAELTGRALRTLGDVVEAARSVIAGGIEAVYASLGADGVLVVTASFAVHASARAVRLANTAGAGDASLAGFLVGLGSGALDDADALVAAASAAASWGAHAVAQASTLLPSLDGMPEAVVTRAPDLATPLSEPASP